MHRPDSNPPAPFTQSIGNMSPHSRASVSITCPAAWGLLGSEASPWLAVQPALNDGESFLDLISAGVVF